MTALPTKKKLKKLFDDSEEIKTANDKYNNAINEWWALQIPVIELLPEQKNQCVRPVSSIL